ncbi:hypothetical protein [Silvanigrella aquatica]|uniref:Uncharacterized protein n=1 Tax=Silvanigrella aquatica TaxID=1915309 RepID=A0A1L4CYN2_9BACT|nr:hypothetical protein [Silvanigrella aquatica]APJ03058.1 hypothetical protein AXG55_03685 [Silvanigrella aquatica]
MYLWKVNDLKKELIENKMTELDKFKYLFFTAMMYSLVYMLNCFYPVEVTTTFSKVTGVIDFIIDFIAIIVIFKINGGRNGKEFLARYTSLHCVFGIRLLVWFIFYFLFVIIASIFISSTMNLNNTDQIQDNLFYAGLNVISIIYYWKIANCIKYIRKEELKSEA